MDKSNQANNLSDLDSIQLVHEALPDFDFEEVQTATTVFGVKLSSPIFISSMTAGHIDGVEINRRLAVLSNEKQIFMGVGSQRRELTDPEAHQEWKSIRKEAPRALLLGNLGITQVIKTPVSQIQKMMDLLEAQGLFIHLNPLQEVLQPEGTPFFRGGLKAIEKLSKELTVPVVVKEVGCGFSASTLMRLSEAGVSAVDVSGAGGTHWGRIEGNRSEKNSILSEASQVFQNWGIGTLRSVLNAKESPVKFQIWASGGIRSGLDAAKLLVLGAKMIGVAQPFLQAALKGQQELFEAYNKMDYQLKVAQFCTGCKNIDELQTKGVWVWK